MTDKSHRWVGKGATSGEYAEVDRRRAMEGTINGISALELATGDQSVPAFGKALRERYWSFEEGWTNLNHGELLSRVFLFLDNLFRCTSLWTGSYGAAPKPVLEAALKIQHANAAAPDRFMRKEYMTQLSEVRAELAELVGCDKHDLVT